MWVYLGVMVLFVVDQARLDNPSLSLECVIVPVGRSC